MRVQRGTTFDPAVLDAFFAIEEEIQDIAARFQDHAPPVDELTSMAAEDEEPAPGVPVAASAE
ncbi:MAG TPA: hypothetical protein VH328_07835, partial [Burkholderiaceae bacterium]|nr:hypothetical protein [Burkholderiaceae bacterium]